MQKFVAPAAYLFVAALSAPQETLPETGEAASVAVVTTEQQPTHEPVEPEESVYITLLSVLAFPLTIFAAAAGSLLGVHTVVHRPSRFMLKSQEPTEITGVERTPPWLTNDLR